jgi:hypothetical protein
MGTTYANVVPITEVAANVKLEHGITPYVGHVGNMLNVFIIHKIKQPVISDIKNNYQNSNFAYVQGLATGVYLIINNANGD